MSKCRPKPSEQLLALEEVGVTVEDVTLVKKGLAGDELKRQVIITIPYEALRDDKNVQLCFQNLITISTEP